MASHNQGMPPASVASSSKDNTNHEAPRRAADPMSFSNILTTNDADPPRSPPSVKKTPRSSNVPLHEETLNANQSATSSPVKGRFLDPSKPSEPSTNGFTPVAAKENRPASRTPANKSTPRGAMSGKSSHNRNVSSQNALSNKSKPTISERECEAALNKIESVVHSDVEAPGFEHHRDTYNKKRSKRSRELDDEEDQKRKRRCQAMVHKISMFATHDATINKERFYQSREKAAHEEVQAKAVAEDKEKKKIQQRNRRRELQKQKHEREAADFQQRAQEANDEAEREKLMKEAKKAEKKVTNTTKLLNGEIPNRDLREATPLAPNLDGGVMGSFQMSDDGQQEPPKKRAKTGGRLKKSKEQKQREKDNAAMAHLAQERGEGEVVNIAPKAEPSRQASKQEAGVAKDTSPAERTLVTSKAYDQLYEQIWRDIAKKDIGKLCRIKDTSLSTKQSNLRKTAQLASKEARRWQLKTNKSQKDTQARAKRVMREMLTFWKRNERDERDQRKMAEKQELENARKAEADREANRQKRKLNFLISQTELYSHFIGKKVKTDEVERSTDDVAASKETSKDGPSSAHTINLPDSVGKPSAKVTDFDQLDFDAEDETALHDAAMANAQNAVQDAQDRARAFNNDGQLQSEFDEGEMNFQNPTSLQSIDIAQPEMVSCALKEYQVKGLNWLVNLYEQGINGILADEMGLGKTLQSISVMAYLAEMHNIWGPFLVIAPASTLHNWQQEIVRFVPGLKVLPYWGTAKDRKVLRKFWDRKHITYTKDSPFHVLVTSYQLVVQDAQYFQKVRWQYMILDEAQAIKSSQSSRWKSLLGFHCRNRLLLTGTPIQNNMQELWALLHFIMPSLFDSHDEFSDWFSKDIESHAQSNTKLNEDQLKRLHMILKPFMLRRIKKHVQKELGDKVEKDVFCDLTYRQRAYYANLRNKISIMDLIEKAAVGDDQDTATLMNLVMQFRKVCNHPDLFERAETMSPVSFAHFAETASFMREGHSVEVGYSIRNLIEYRLPRLIACRDGRLDIAGPGNEKAGWRNRFLNHELNVWSPHHILRSSKRKDAFSWLCFVDASAGTVAKTARKDIFQRAVDVCSEPFKSTGPMMLDEDKENYHPTQSMFNIVQKAGSSRLIANFNEGPLHDLLNVSRRSFEDSGFNVIEPATKLAASAPPVELYCAAQAPIKEKRETFFNVPMRRALFETSTKTESLMLDEKMDPASFPPSNLLPPPLSEKSRFTNIRCPSMRRFVTDSGKLAKLDALLSELKEGNHRVLLYFQMTRMIDLMEEYLTYRNYKYCRLDGSTKLEDRRDTVADFQNRPDMFVFLLSTRAGGLGINLTAADTVIFYDSDWNPTIDSQAMDRAHRLGQTKQVTVYRLITRGTIEERIRRRALQKEEVQRVVISGGAGAHVDFNTRSRENRTKDIAMWLADEDQAAEIEKKEAELKEKEEKEGPTKRGKKAGGGGGAAKRGKEVTMDDMYHEGEGHFDDMNKPSGTATPVNGGGGDSGAAGGKNAKRKGTSKKAKSVKEKLAIIDGGM
ncbi:MAG: putative DNA helicase ino80 [Alyxoria varia]|nr:MAG: putative DNA helicase ino80 [Alyxoria varia]